jgi:transposase InsO family protein
VRTTRRPSRRITCSMSRRGNCYDNSVTEAFFSTAKNEVGERFASHGEAKAHLFDDIEVFYNQRRRHSSAGRMSPAAFERLHGSSRVAKPSTESDQAHARMGLCTKALRRRARRSAACATDGTVP